MEFNLPTVFLSVMVLAIISYPATADSPPQVYWNTVLPNTAMPKAVKDLLRPDSVSPVHVSSAGPLPPFYMLAATEDQLRDKLSVNLFFFLEKDLHLGSKMTLHFRSKSSNSDSVSFLPRPVAESFPFSSDKFPEILEKLSVKPRSEEAHTLRTTIDLCEDAGIRGEDKRCPTSLESMVDFATSRLGRDVEAASSSGVIIQGHADPQQLQNYRIVGIREMGQHRNGGGDEVICHRLAYSYGVFYCHKFGRTKVYTVSLTGAAGTEAELVAVCHENTSAWNPKHLAFHVLDGVTPGSAPICHFLPDGNVVWVPKHSYLSTFV